MSDDLIEGALLAARNYLRQAQNANVTYGYYPGGDPRQFTPDFECCTTEELAAHKFACEAWERGERPSHDAHRHTVEKFGDKLVLASHAGAFGLGVYSIRDEEADDVLEQLDAAIGAMVER